jgi:hypothetical protein
MSAPARWTKRADEFDFMAHHPPVASARFAGSEAAHGGEKTLAHGSGFMTRPADSTHPADPSDVVTIEQQLAAACQSLERERMENQRLREDVSRQTALLDEILLSTAWKLTAPLRDYGKLRQKVRRAIHALPAIAARTGGWRALTRITYQAWRRRGSAEVLRLAHNQVGTVDAPGHPAAAIIEPEPAIDCPSSVASDRPAVLFISHEAEPHGCAGVSPRPDTIIWLLLVSTNLSFCSVAEANWSPTSGNAAPPLSSTRAVTQFQLPLPG